MAYWTELGDFRACFFTKATDVTPVALPSLAMATSVCYWGWLSWSKFFFIGPKLFVL